MSELIKKEEPPLDRTKSLYDQSRDTAGKIYRDALINNSEDCIQIGDMAHELTKSLVEDINDSIKSFDIKGKPYYLLVEEKRDLQMKRALCRRMHYFGYRPYPEDNTMVFWKNPKAQELRFCWCLPHWSEMDLTLMHESQFDPEYIHQIKCWKKVDLTPFGFWHHKELKWIPNKRWKDKPIEQFKRSDV